jgi:hypothetical protein
LDILSDPGAVEANDILFPHLLQRAIGKAAPGIGQEDAWGIQLVFLLLVNLQIDAAGMEILDSIVLRVIGNNPLPLLVHIDNTE